MAAIGFIGSATWAARWPPISSRPAVTFWVRPSRRVARSAAKDSVQIVANAKATVEDADIVITMLPRRAGVGGVERHRAAGAAGHAVHRLLDHRRRSARKAHKLAASYGIATLDAPVSAASRGQNGDTHVHGRRLRPRIRARQAVLERMGKRIVHCGEAGNGQAAKICNNMISALR